MNEEPKPTIESKVTAFLLGQRFGTVVLIVLGLSTAILLLLFLGKISGSTQNATDTKKKNDTVYVKLVDSLSLGVLAANSQPVSSGNPDTMLAGSQRNSSAPYRRDTLQAPPVSPKAKPLAEADLQKIAAANSVKIPVWKWLVVPLVLVYLGLGAFSYYKRLPSANYKRDIDKDPEELTHLFGRHLKDIESLGNPRKIKRFSNKVRFQYHYLDNQNRFSDRSLEITRSAELDKVLYTLLFIDKNLSKMSLDKLSETDKKDPLRWFRDLIKQEILVDLSDDLAKPLLALNKNVIA